VPFPTAFEGLWLGLKSKTKEGNQMKAIVGLGLGLMLCAVCAYAEPKSQVKGDYVEIRSASILAGPCHSQGEFGLAGREGTLVWHVREGVWKGTSLKGLSIAAVVVADSPLALDTKTRRSVLYVDAKGTAEQRAALADMVTAKYGAALGKVVATKSAPVAYKNDGLDYKVTVGDVATISVNRYPCNHCTEKPYEIWYQPFINVKDAIVGKTVFSQYRDNVLPNVGWRDSEEKNSAYVATFSF
jgi:hypothetical protein